MTTVWGITSFDNGAGGYVVHCLFTTEDEARKYATQDSEYEVEAFTLYEKAPAPYTIWQRGAAVYPDGHVADFSREEIAQPPYMHPPLNDDLVGRGPWDGHMQGHCGEHIYISGTDKDLVEQSFQRHLAAARARQDGVCHAKFGKHEGAVDGINVYKTGMRTVRRKGNAQEETLECYNAFEHDWDEWGEWHEVGPGQFNRQRSCKRCSVWTIAFSSEAALQKASAL